MLHTSLKHEREQRIILRKKVRVLLGELCVTPDKEAVSHSCGCLSNTPHTCDYVMCVHQTMNGNIKQIAFLMVQY